MEILPLNKQDRSYKIGLKSMTLNFSTIFITEATSGMGLELAKRFLTQGVKVVTIGGNEERLGELQELGAIVERLDIGLSEDIEKACLLMQNYQPDLVYHPAGGTEYGRLYDRPLESLRP